MALPYPTLLIKPNGSRDRSGPVSPTLQGAVRVVDGEHGDAWFVEEGTTNLFTNPTALNGLSQWQDIGSVTKTTEPSTHPDFPGINMVKVVTTGTQSGDGVRAASPTGGMGYTTTARTFAMQFWFKGTQGEAFYSNAFAWYITGGVSTFDTTIVNWTATGDWQLIQAPPVTARADGGTLSHVLIDGARTPEARATTWYVLTPQMEEKAYHTSIAHGSMGTGYTWAGAAHASASTRASSFVRHPVTNVIDSDYGSLMLDVEVISTKRFQEFVDIGASTTADWIRVYGDNQVLNVLWSRGASSYGLGAGTIPVGSRRLYMAWTPTTMVVMPEGMEAVSRTKGESASGGFGATNVALGRYDAGATHYVNSRVAPLVAFDRPLTDAERTELFAMDAWEWDRFGGRTLSFAAISS